MFEIFGQAPVTQAETMPPAIERGVESQHHIIGPIAQHGKPGSQAGDTIKQITVYHEISLTVRTPMIGLVYYLYTTKRHAQGYHGSQELVVIAYHIYHSRASPGMCEYPAYDIGMALPPAQFILLNFPAIYDIAHEIQGVAGMVFEEVIELFGLAVFDTEMHVRDEDAAEMLRHSNI